MPRDDKFSCTDSALGLHLDITDFWRVWTDGTELILGSGKVDQYSSASTVDAAFNADPGTEQFWAS